jgi:hypothetical protein
MVGVSKELYNGIPNVWPVLRKRLHSKKYELSIGLLRLDFGFEFYLSKVDSQMLVLAVTSIVFSLIISSRYMTTTT